MLLEVSFENSVFILNHGIYVMKGVKTSVRDVLEVNTERCKQVNIFVTCPIESLFNIHLF